MNRTVGTCSICGGRVSTPEAWYATVPPVPRCESCGATMSAPWGPIIIPMTPASQDNSNLDEILSRTLRPLKVGDELVTRPIFRTGK